jgi:Family of unknown function (DUF6176)
METRCARFRLRPGSVERVREWAAELNRRTDEVLATLRDERVAIESAFLDRASDGDFLAYYMRAASIEGARDTAARSTHAIDQYHRRLMEEVVESSERLELLIDFENPAA